MHLTLIQPDLHWQNPNANRAMLEEVIATIETPTDLIILPEMFTSGFTMEAAAVAEPMGLATFRWMKQLAARTNAVVTGSYIVKEGYTYRNRLVWMQPDGQFDSYDKRHLFRLAGEQHTYTPGQSRLIKEWRGWRICPLICYDLRFPVFSRNIQPPSCEPAYDLLLYVANWPAARAQAWQTLLQARAIENLSYVVGVNRTGTDGNGITYSGHSAVIDFQGQLLHQMPTAQTVWQQSVSLPDLQAFRTQFPFYLDADV